MKSLSTFIGESEEKVVKSKKTMKKEFFGGDIKVEIKFSEVKGNPNIINTKVYITDKFGRKKAYFPKSILSEVLGFDCTTEEGFNKVKENYGASFFIDGHDAIGFKNGYSFLNNTGVTKGGYFHPNDEEFELSSVNTSRDYYSFDFYRNSLASSPLEFKLVPRRNKNVEEKVVFSIDLSNANISGQRKANIMGLNDHIFHFIKMFGPLWGCESKDADEITKWYNGLKQKDADNIRKIESTYWIGKGASESASEKQIDFIKKLNGDEIVKKLGGYDKLSKKGASLVIDYLKN